ncbi:MAG: hypothetical protein ACI8PZ_001944 [Myxococcota bacterium]|jgi:hypothetical protein
MFTVALVILGLTGCTDPAATDANGEGAAAEEFEGDAAGECSDGADNDKDGWFDCNDQDCFNSPDCLNGGPGTGTATGGGTGGGSGTGGGGTGGGGTGTGGGGVDCTTPICDLKNVSLTYTLEVDWNEGIDLGLGLIPTDCIITMEGGGDLWEVDNNIVTFVGFWEESYNDCDEGQQDLVHQWLGGAFHSFLFDPSQMVLLDWIAHRDDGEKNDNADPSFYITEIEYEVDMSTIDPTVDYTLEEMMPLDPIFLPDVAAAWLTSHLQIQFEN